MPNHTTHDIIGVITAVPLTVGMYTIAWILTEDVKQTTNAATVLAASHIFSTFFLSPDMDINSRIYNRWSIFRIVWWPYKQIVPHRSKISHSALGGMARMIYLLILCGIVAAVVANEWLAMAISMGFEYPLYFAMIMLGSSSASFFHVLADGIRPDR